MAETLIAPSAGPSGSGSGDVVGPASSVDGQIALYSGVTGKLLKLPTGTGPVHATAGVYSVGNIDLTSEVTGDLPYANLAQASAASRLLGRGSASGAGDWQEITLGSNLTMTGTSLAASGGGGGSSATIAIVASDVVHATNNTTLSDITGLTFNTTASATELWWVDVLLLTNANTNAGTTARFKFGWTVSGAQTIRWGGNVESGFNVAIQPAVGTEATTLNYPSAANVNGMIRLVALVAANSVAGAIQLQFAQNATAASGVVTIKANSTMMANKVRA